MLKEWVNVTRSDFGNLTYKLCSYCEVFLDVQEQAADVPAKICGNTGACIFFKYADNVVRFEVCASNLLIIIVTLQLSKCYVSFTSIFVIFVLSLFDIMSIYSFSI